MTKYRQQLVQNPCPCMPFVPSALPGPLHTIEQRVAVDIDNSVTKTLWHLFGLNSLQVTMLRALRQST